MFFFQFSWHVIFCGYRCVSFFLYFGVFMFHDSSRCVVFSLCFGCFIFRRHMYSSTTITVIFVVSLSLFIVILFGIVGSFFPVVFFLFTSASFSCYSFT